MNHVQLYRRRLLQSVSAGVIGYGLPELLGETEPSTNEKWTPLVTGELLVLKKGEVVYITSDSPK